MTHISDKDIERILKVKNADLGLFVLAMHSLMERALKEKYHSTSDFGVLINDYTDEYYRTYGIPIYKGAEKRNLPKDKWDTYQILRRIYTNHFLSNNVRHEFAEIYEEQAQTTVLCFLAFAEAEGWSNIHTIRKLESELENWKNHGDYQSAELKKAIAEISKLKSENENLARKANELSDLQNQLAILKARENVLKTELTETEARLSKKDEKLDKVRQNANEQYQKLRKEKEAIQEKIKDYEQTKKYLEYLERVSFYTKTRHDYERSIISLSRDQEDILNQINMKKDFLVKGAAGTGKSLVLIKTLEKAIKEFGSELSFDENKKCFRLLTYAKSLVKYNQYVTKLLNADVPDGTITTADSFVYAMMKHFFPDKKLVYDYENISEDVFCDDYFDGEDVFKEAQSFIWANCITKEQYVDEVCERGGMKLPMKKTDRKKMWKQLTAAEESLQNQNLWPRNYAAKKIVERLLEGGEEVESIMAEYSFVDEAQDLPPVVLAVIKNTTRRAVFLAGDSDQSIYRKGFNWNKSGIDIIGRTKILKTNFRNTTQIHEYAENYRSTFKNKDKTTTPQAFRPGPPVEHIVCKNTDDAMIQMIEQVKLLMNALNYAEENICIIANTNKKLEKFQKLLEEKLGVEANIINDEFEFETTGGIRLCTMQKCKGLDFPVVLFLADHRVRGAEEGSVYDEETFMTQQFNMVYVALTRAMEMLYVYTVKGSEFEAFNRLS